MKANLKSKLDEAKNSYERKQDDIKKKKDKKKKQRIFAAAAGVILVIACIGYASVMGSSDQESKQTSTDYISADKESDDVALMEEEAISVAEVKQQLEGADATTSNENGKSDGSQLGEERNPLTSENCPDFARILALTSDETNQFIEFADKYYGQVISFDGYISDSMSSSDRFHERYKYYNDWLVSPGDYVDENHVSSGPVFKIEYVGRPDFKDESEAAVASTGSNIKITARVGKFDESAQVLFLDQLEIELR